MSCVCGALRVIPGRAKRGLGIHNLDWCDFALFVVMDSRLASGACHRAGHFGPDPLARARE
jgi:hypothetical protein